MKQAPVLCAAFACALAMGPATAAAQSATRWYEKFQLEGFIDAYAGVNYNFPTVQSGQNGFRAYDTTNGAALSWAGLNVSYPAAPVGATVSLRFGPSTRLYAGTDSGVDLSNLKQAYATWKPGGEAGKLTIDFGKYDQPFGSEVADSQYNMNYTRSVLYWYAQPLFLTGFRVDYAPVKELGVKLFAVNGWNNSVDNNAGKSGAIQVALRPSDAFTAYLGYMLGPEQADSASVTCGLGTAFDPATRGCVAAPSAAGGTTVVAHGEANKRLRHLVDVVIDVNPTKDLRLLVNGDYGHDEVPSGATTKPVSWYGGNLGVRYAFTDQFALAARGGVFWDPDGFMTATGKFTRVTDTTLTVAVSPTPNLILKLDGRVDRANEAFFVRGASDTSRVQVTTTLGVVATTN